MIHIGYFIAIVGNRFISFGAFLALAYILSPQDFGVYSLAFTNAIALESLSTNWMMHGGSRLVAIARGNDEAEVATTAASMLGFFALCLIGALVYAVFPFTAVPPRMVALVLAWSAALLLWELTGALQSAREQVSSFTALAISRNVSAAVLCITGGYFAGPQGAVAGQVVGTLGATLLLPSARRTWSNVRLRNASRHVLRAMLAFGLVATFVTSLYMLAGLALRNPIAIQLGEASAGTVSLATDLFFVPLALVLNAFGITQGVMMTRISALDKTSPERRKHLEKYLDQILLVVVPYVAGGVLLAAPLVGFVLPGSIGDRIAAIATPAALFGGALGTLYALSGSLATFKHYAMLVVLALVTASSIFVVTLRFAERGADTVLYIAAAIAATAADIGYVDLAIRGGARLLTPNRIKIVVASLAMSIAVLLWSRIDTREPVSAMLIGLAVYGGLVVRFRVIAWSDLFGRTLPVSNASHEAVSTTNSQV